MEFIFIANGIFPESVGGIQRFSKLLIEKLIEYPEVTKIHLIHTEAEKLFTNEKIAEYKVPSIDTRKIYFFELYKLSKNIYNVIETLDKKLPIYAQGFVVWYNLSKLKHRLIYNPHGLEAFQATPKIEYLKLLPFRLLSIYIFRNSKFVISLGGKLTKIINNYIESTSIRHIPNAVNLRTPDLSEKKFIDKKLKFLFVSRFAYNKGIDVLLNAINIVNKKGYSDRIIFNLGGKGPLYEYYKANIHKYKNVNLLGFVEDNQLWELYQESDVFVFPTQFEGMPTVILEAMSFSLAIIVSNVGATAELVDSSNGYVLHNKKDERELADIIIKIIDIPDEEKRELSKNSYNRVKEKYTWDIIAVNTLKLIKEISWEK